MKLRFHWNYAIVNYLSCHLQSSFPQREHARTHAWDKPNGDVPLQGLLTWLSVIEIISSEGTEGGRPPALTQGLLEFVVLSGQCLQSLCQSFVLLHLLLQLQTPHLKMQDDQTDEWTIAFFFDWLMVWSIRRYWSASIAATMCVLEVLMEVHCVKPARSSGFLQSEPNTRVSGAKYWMSLQSNLSQATVGQTRSGFPVV